MNINNQATERCGGRAIVRPGFVAEAGKSASARLLKLPATDVPALLPSTSTKLSGVVVAEQGRAPSRLCNYCREIFICRNNSMLTETCQGMARLWKGT